MCIRDRSIDKLLRAAKEQKFDVVLVAEVSRMSRDPASGRVYVCLLYTSRCV